MHQITCDNLGMTRDMSISSLAKGEDGSTNYAFENHNIRVLAVNDNTKFSVTNEKSTKYETSIKGVFIGGCTCGRYLVVFMQDPQLMRNNRHRADYIYRLEYDGSTVKVLQLYNGNLGFSVKHPIEAIGYYESEEVQKVYWVDGLNQNRFINIVKFNEDEASEEDIEKKYFFHVWLDLTNDGVSNDTLEALYYKHANNVSLTGGTLYALCRKDSSVVCYAAALTAGADVWLPSEIVGITTFSSLPAASHSIDTKTFQYNDYSFDFQGRIDYIPNVTKLEKNYSKSGTFQAGVLQYFFTYYNKYGVETCLVWNSDLQYISLSDRGGKADEGVSCGFDFEITNLEEKYDYLRIYAAYRSGLNGVVSAKIVADISLENMSHNSVIKFTDLGSAGINFNAEDLPYIGGQDIRANTLDYKQDTLFLGDITLKNAPTDIQFPKFPVDITTIGDFESTQEIPSVVIQEGGIDSSRPFLTWAYKFVSPVMTEGLYSYTPEIKKSQEAVAGFKYREVYRFGIQFMDKEGTWTSAYWLGDKYCDLAPRTFTESDLYVTERIGGIPLDYRDNIINPMVGTEVVAQQFEGGAVLRAPSRALPGIPSSSDTVEIETVPIDEKYGFDKFGNYIREDKYDENGERIYDEEVGTYRGTIIRKKTYFAYEGEGCYMATIMLDINAVKDSRPDIDFSKYVAYRLLVVDTDITNRRIVEQGVINPTMFNYVDRYYNRPFSIPSWIFRPRMSAITNRHYDTLPVQTADNAELQGIISKQVPGFDAPKGNLMNAYMFIVAVNEASVWSGHIQWKLIYYNSGATDLEKAERLYLAMYKGSNAFPEGTSSTDKEAEYTMVANLILKYGLPMKPADNYYPGQGKVDPCNASGQTDQQKIDAIKGYLRQNYVPMYIYKAVEGMGGGYKIISSHIYDNDNSSGTTTPSTWGSLRGHLEEWSYADMHNTTAEDVGEIVAGQIVLPPATLPSADLIKMIARAGSSATEIAMAILAALVAAAAIVISALSFGTLAAPMAVAATVAISAAVSICAASAIGMASAACVLDLQRQDMQELPKKMLALGYYPVGQNDTGLNSRKERSKNIGLLLDSFFEPVGYTQNSGLAGFNSWNVPVLDGEARDGNGNVNFGDDAGNVPFTTGHPYTAKGRIGEDYNAFVLTGQLSALSAEEADLKNKQNLFCVDESIVTLNAPDIEDVSPVINGSEGLRLDLVGMIPIEATYGMYNLVTENGLNSMSQVLQGRFRTNKLGEEPLKALGMLNGYIYQDFKAEEDNFTADHPEQVVNENTDNYRLFMWNRNIAGFWFPNFTVKSQIDESPILEPTSKIENKIFANMRYSTSSIFYPTKKLNIESPTVCMDAEAMLKTFHHHSDIKNYYENVDTISVNNENYPLVLNGLSYPQLDTSINHGNLKDPVAIRYKETPHVVIPFLWDDNVNAANILPYTDNEDMLSPLDLYDEETLGDIKLYGIYNNARPIGQTYTFITDPDASTISNDMWGYEGDMSATYPDTSLTWAEACHQWFPDFDATKTSVTYLLKSGKLYYYTLYYQDSKWYSVRTRKILQNSKILIGEATYYATKNANSSTGEITLINDFMSLLTKNPIVGTWLQDRLTWRYKGETPYLFLGELVKKVFDYDTWNGGTNEQALEQLVWNVASHVTPIDEHVTKAWGDTYYQRWDCEKTYPFTEQDVNSNVEILSFMLESHVNLDGRCDVNRGLHNLLNTRPHNTIFNNVYSQEDNFFTYQVLDEKFSKSHFEADIVWSLTKNNMDEIDKWTCLLASNEMSLDGRYGTVRKVLNVNDVLVTFQDTGIANIRYNETAALNTTSGLPLQMGNTGKVDGYRMISDTIGCHNKFSINKNSAGVFFADDFGKSFNQFTVNGGISDISMRANFSSWFKKNLNGHLWEADTRDNFRVSYDEITHDLYIVKKDICLIYNTLLQKFTSFMDYIDTPMITRLISNGGDSDTFAIRSTVNAARQSIIEVWKMFAGASTDIIYGSQGAYGYIYGAFRPYSMEYRLNPDPFHDSIFTNYQFAADWTDPTKEVDEDNIFDSSARRYTTFDTVEAKNEYQQGIMAVLPRVNGYNRAMGRQPLKSMFRLWRGDIPRNGDTLSGHTPLSDRMRNPWIHLKFTKTTADDSKMTFHNLMVNYYNQYGRF